MDHKLTELLISGLGSSDAGPETPAKQNIKKLCESQVCRFSRLNHLLSFKTDLDWKEEVPSSAATLKLTHIPVVQARFLIFKKTGGTRETP